jgi:hypothetical protein
MLNSAGLVVLSTAMLLGQAGSPPAVEYRIFSGNTHSHTAYTWSHGDQFTTNGCTGILTYSKDPASAAYKWSDGYVKTAGDGCAGIYVINGAQIPAPGVTVKPDWQKFQGPPAAHYAAAKAAGYDFYAVTDHSQEAGLLPSADNNPEWLDTKQQTAAATDNHFVALAGFEYSENDGPGGTGHLNVYNSAGILNALAPGIDLPYFYKWLVTAQPNGDGPVVASFNHPDAEQYNNWAYRDARVTDIITMLEVINSNNKIHYPAFVNALDHGWKVSPICGNDNHGLGGITRQTSRTFVLASARTEAAILDAMKNRRTYASLSKNIQCRYSVNGAIMGSTLKSAGQFQFDISVSQPVQNNPKDRITKIDIVKDGGAVVQTWSPTPDYAVHWTPTVTDSTSKYFFVRVWTAGGGDAPGADPANPVAWLAPVWTGR